METNRKNEIVEQTKENSKFFEIRIVIKIFGVIVVDYTWPPKKN